MLDDARDLERVVARTLPDALPLLAAQFDEHDIAVGREELERALAGLVDHPERGFVLLARAGERAVGLAVIATTWTLEHAGLVAWLDELYVVPDLRNKGIGVRLLRAAIDGARAMGCRAIELEVEAEHTRAARLYTREGFEPLARTRYSLVLD